MSLSPSLGGPLLSRRSAALGAAAMLAGCARGPDARSVSLWAMDVEGENARAILPAFTRATKLSVDLQWLAWSSAHEKLLTAEAGGSLPDVVMLANGWLGEFAMIGALAPLPAGGRGLLADQFPLVLAATRVGGGAVALPWVVDTMVQYVRRDLAAAAGFEDLPPTWEGWRAMLRAMAGRRRDGWPLFLPVNVPDPLLAFAAQQPEPLLRDRETRGNFRSAGFRAALGFYKSLFDERLAPVLSSTEVSDPNLELARGWVGVILGWVWSRADLLRRRAMIAPGRWMPAELPGPSGPAQALTAGSSLAVTAGARHAADGWALARYLCTPATQVRFHRVAGNLPSRPSAWAAPALAGDPTLAPFRAQIARAAPQPAALEWNRITGEVQAIAERMVRGEFGVDAAAALMDARADAILAKRRTLVDRGRIA